MEPLISVIIPVYNCERYLTNAVKSVLDQSYKNTEIILIDDCSSDDSYKIAQELKASDERIVVLRTKQNSGASVARNMGLDYCHGEYIAYVDSDDYVHPEYLSQLYMSVVDNKADIALCGFYKTYEPSVKEHKELTHKAGFTRDGLSSAYHLIARDSILYVVLWNKLYKREIWENLRFPEGMASEDFHVCYKLFARASVVSFVPERLYYYYQNPDSVMHTCTDISKFNDKTLDEFDIFLKENVADEAALKELLAESLKYRTDSVVEDYYLAHKKKDKERMNACASKFDGLYEKMKTNGDPLPVKFRLFDLNKAIYKMGRGLIELRDLIMIKFGSDKQGEIL